MEKSQALEPTWSELLGSNNWEGLLEPLDLSLRRLILRCGNFCQATYDAFNNDKNSKYCGSCRYGKNDFFNKVMLESASNYQIGSFLYATSKLRDGDAFITRSSSPKSWDAESNWIGYIAVTTDKVSQSLGQREVYVVWRGTIRTLEWVNDMKAGSVPIDQLLSSEGSLGGDDGNVPEVMEGWLSIYVSDNPDSPFTKLSARSQLWTKIKEIRKQYENENLSIIVTGHSLGGSLSVLSAFDLVENAVIDTDTPVTAIGFCSPKVGNQAFNDRVKQLSNLKILQIKNKIDVVPKYPFSWRYVNTSVELEIDNRKSPYLKHSINPSDWHNLESGLHTVAGWNGDDKEFELQVKRSLALVNKSCGVLKDEYLIPESWWVEKNKGMVMTEDGEWVLDEPSDEDKLQAEFLVLSRS